MQNFIGREQDLKLLQQFLHKKTASLLVVNGRRRIGKTTLIAQFAKPYTFYSFTGLPPDSLTTSQLERDEFSRQLSVQTDLPEVKADDWSKLFSLLATKVQTGRVVLLFDEISWMGSKDPAFLGKIKHAWDTQFKKNPKLLFIICGSASSWIEKNILSSTGFLGRISHVLTLEELPLNECNAFWGKKGAENIAAFEKFNILSITGGIPRYLEELNPAESAEQTLKRICFQKGALLLEEFDRIFSDLFLHDSHVYKKILKTLAQGSHDTKTISEKIKINFTGLFSEFLRELELAGFVKRDYTWDIQTGVDSKLSRYRLSDNYMRFYLKCLEKKRTQIERGTFIYKSITSLPEWNSIIGLQFENLVLNNRHHIHQKLGIDPADIVTENPFFQKTTARQQGCQIDYMIQTRHQSLYICEIKFSQKPIGSEVIPQVQEKINRLKRPKGFSCRPVLIHVNGVSQDVIDKDFFSNIIDLSQALR